MERKEVNPDGTAVAAQKENRPVLSRNTSQVSPVSSGATRHAHSVCSSDCTPPTAASGTTRGPPPKYLSRRTLALTNQPAAAVAPKKSPAGNCPPCNTGRSFLDRHGLAKVEPNLAVVRCSSCSRPRNIGSGEGEGQHRHRSPPPRYKSLVSKHFPKTSGVPPLSAQPKFNSFGKSSYMTLMQQTDDQFSYTAQDLVEVDIFRILVRRWHAWWRCLGGPSGSGHKNAKHRTTRNEANDTF